MNASRDHDRFHVTMEYVACANQSTYFDKLELLLGYI